VILLLALRNLTHRPLRTLLLLLAYGLGVSVMIVLLSVGEALITQARDERLVGGGEITVLPEGIDVEVLKTGGLGGLYFSIPNARFVHLQLLAAPRLAGQLRDLQRPGVAALFVAAVLTWSLFALQDSVLTGLGRAVWIPLENILYSAAKLVLVLALAAGLGGYGILVSWVVPAALAVVPVVLAVFKVFIPAHLEAYGTEPARGTDLFRRFVAGDGLGMLLAQVHTALLPILVMELAGAETAGRFFIPWMLVQSLDLVAVNVGMSLTVQGAHAQDQLPSMFRRLLLRTLALVGLLVAGAIVAAPLVLALFGAGYANASVEAFRLLLLGLVFRVVITLAICAARAERRPSVVIALQAGLTVVLLPLAWRLTPGLGAAGAALAWTIGQAAVAGLAVLLVRHLLRESRRPPGPARRGLVDQLSEVP